jgi:hypothetical protein
MQKQSFNNAGSFIWASRRGTWAAQDLRWARGRFAADWSIELPSMAVKISCTAGGFL